MRIDIDPKLRILTVFSLFAVIFFAQSATAQDKGWLPVSPSDLQLAEPLVEKGADAEAIFWETRIDDSSSYDLTVRHYVRVKIFTERGREKYSKFDIPFVKGERIRDLAARVIQTDGTIVEIKKDEIFEREIIRASGLKMKAKSFAIPNIEPGVIIEYRYREQTSDAGAIGMKLLLQRDIPVRKLDYYYKPYTGEPVYKAYNISDVRFIKDRGGYYLASRTNVPSFKEEPFMPPDDMVRPWIRLGRGRISITSLLAKTQLAGLLKKDRGDMKKLAAELSAGVNNDEEKLKRFYEYSQSQINNTTFDPSLTDEMRDKLPENKGPKDTVKRKSGSAMEIDILFGSLAINSGMDARIAYIGDRRRMFTSSRNIDQDFLRPAAIGVKVNGQWQFFNPGMKFLPFRKLVWYEEDSAAELVSETHIEWTQTPISPPEYSVSKRKGRFTLAEDGTLEGTVVVELHGHSAVDYRSENFDETPAKLEELLIDDAKRFMSTAEVSDVTIENLSDNALPVVQKYRVKVPNFAQRTGRRMFIQPSYFRHGVPPYFSSSTRLYSISFRFPWSEHDSIEIKMPSGFELENAESPGTIVDSGRIGQHATEIKIDNSSNTMMYDRKFYFGAGGNLVFPTSSYTNLKRMFDGFHDADAHAITLRQQ
ncbi:MAG: DUF3857 domain-containing protein [Acidobacteria bacterium]|nr:DUF3857 domain-containing protein [Acidobacteriota bacterium]